MGFFDSYRVGRRQGITGVLTVREAEKEAEKEEKPKRRVKPVPWRKKLSNR